MSESIGSERLPLAGCSPTGKVVQHRMCVVPRPGATFRIRHQLLRSENHVFRTRNHLFRTRNERPGSVIQCSGSEINVWDSESTFLNTESAFPRLGKRFPRLGNLSFLFISTAYFFWTKNVFPVWGKRAAPWTFSNDSPRELSH